MPDRPLSAGYNRRVAMDPTCALGSTLTPPSRCGAVVGLLDQVRAHAADRVRRVSAAQVVSRMGTPSVGMAETGSSCRAEVRRVVIHFRLGRPLLLTCDPVE